MNDIPQNPSAFLEAYPEGLRALGATLKPLRAIMLQTMQTQGLDYTGAVSYLVNEYFVLTFSEYVSTYDSERGTFLDYCRIRFAYRVRSANEYALRVSKARSARGRGQDSRDVETVGAVESHSALEYHDCQVCNAIAWEDRKLELQALADVVQSLKSLDSTSAYIVWQHSALGVSYDRIGEALGMSGARVKALHRGAVATLRR